MRDYSVSGDFGQVKFYNTGRPSGRYKSAAHILNMGWHKVNQLYYIQRQSGLDTNLLLLTRKGKGLINIEGRNIAALQGSAVIIPKNQKHSYAAAGGCEWEFYWMHYTGETAQAYTDDILNLHNNINIGLNIIDSSIKEFEDRNWEEPELMESALLNHILFEMLLTASKSNSARSDTSIASDMIHYMENNIESNFSLSQLAHQYHYTKEYIIKLFKEATGITPYSYWRRLRLRQSCRELQSAGVSIKQIARKYGYSSISSYTNQFKKLYGISPSEYKNSERFH